MQVPKLIFNALIWITIHLTLINDSHRDSLSLTLQWPCSSGLTWIFAPLLRHKLWPFWNAFSMAALWLPLLLLFSSRLFSVLFCSGVACLAAGRIKLQFYCSEAWKSNCYFTKSQQQQQRQQLRYWATARTAPVGCVQGIRLHGPKRGGGGGRGAVGGSQSVA